MRSDCIALYIRLSEEDGDLKTGKNESNSISNQKLLLKQFIEEKEELRDCKIMEFYDDGYSGTNFERPAFTEMMELVKLKKINCIIVKDLSRFGRSFLDVSSYLELILPLFNVRFISVNDDFDSNEFIGSTGGIRLAFRNLINAMYSKDLSSKVKSARLTRFKSGEYLGGHPFYGYLRNPKDKHRLIIDEEVKDIIAEIFERCINGESTATIAKALNKRKLLCPLEYRKKRGIRYPKDTLEEQALWIPCTVRKIIKDERYTGKMISNVCRVTDIGKNSIANNDPKDWIIVDNTHEAIISDEIFRLANAALAARVKAKNMNTSSLNSNNLFVCYCCGRKLQKTTGKEISLYCLKSKYTNTAACATLRVNKEMLEKTVLTIIKKMGQILMNKANLIKKQKNYNRLQENLSGIKKSIQKIKNGKVSLYEQYKAGKMSRQQFIDAQNESAEKVNSLEQLIAIKQKELEKEIEKQKSLDLVKKDVQAIEVLENYDSAVIARLIKKIIVFNDKKIEIVMLHQDIYEKFISIQIINNNIST